MAFRLLKWMEVLITSDSNSNELTGKYSGEFYWDMSLKFFKEVFLEHQTTLSTILKIILKINHTFNI